ncbi:MAG: GNAT family N-acetyltransferase [Deltaproteobacteria bacterium]
MGHFEIKLAANDEEVRSAQRLRYQVFVEEMGCRVPAAGRENLDADPFDPLCDHIIIVDKSSGLTIGTYRLLRRSRLRPRGRFYAESEFDISAIRALPGELLELGRSCVHKDYRRQAVLNRLWARIAAYIQAHRVTHLFGCSSVYTQDPGEVSRFHGFLMRRYAADPACRVTPTRRCAVPGLTSCRLLPDEEKKTALKLPAMLRSYLKLGARVCGPPALDREFGTVDFFMLLGVAEISRTYLRRLGLEGVVA